MNEGKMLRVGIAVSGGAIARGPRVRVKETYGPPILPADFDAYLAGAESQLSDITPNTEKKIIWAGVPGAKTPLSIVYLHGFTATRQELPLIHI